MQAKSSPWAMVVGLALAMATAKLFEPFAEPCVYAAGLCAGFWPCAAWARKKFGRRFAALACSGIFALALGIPGSWAWGHAFSEIDPLIEALPTYERSSDQKQRAIGAISSMLKEVRANKGWSDRVKTSTSLPWGTLGLIAILSFFFVADGERGLLWLRKTAAGLGPGASEAFEAGLLGFTQTAKGCLYFGTASALGLWGLFAWAQAPSPLALAVAGACASMFPFIAPVMIAGVAFALMGPGNWAGPFALLLIGAGGLGVANNVLRPKWVGETACLPMPLALLGMAGGAIVWGPAGLLVGPALASAALSAAGRLRAAGDKDA